MRTSDTADLIVPDRSTALVAPLMNEAEGRVPARASRSRRSSVRPLTSSHRTRECGPLFKDEPRNPLRVPTKIENTSAIAKTMARSPRRTTCVTDDLPAIAAARTSRSSRSRFRRGRCSADDAIATDLRQRPQLRDRDAAGSSAGCQRGAARSEHQERFGNPRTAGPPGPVEGTLDDRTRTAISTST